MAGISGQEYEKIIDDAPVGVYVTSVKGEILFVNKAAASLFEYNSPEELQAEKVVSRYRDPKDRGILLDKLKKDGKATDFEVSLLTKTGKTIEVLLNATLLDDRLTGMLIDITKRKKMEEDIKESEDKFKTLFQSAADGIVRVNTRGILTDINPRLEEMTGLKIENYIGKHFSTLRDIFPMSSIAIIVKHFGERLLGKEIPPYEVEMKRKDGSLIRVEINAKAVKQNGKISSIIVVLRDISQRKRAEQDLRQKMTEIEKLNKFLVGRETRIVEMKDEVNNLLKELGRSVKYKE